MNNHDVSGKIESFLQRLAARDPELHREVKEKIDLRPHEETFREVARADPRFRRIESINPERAVIRVAETIVKSNARPVLTIRENKITEEFVGPSSEIWRQRLLAARNRINSVIPAVGRIELSNNPQYDWVGTGWLVESEIIITNRHVARIFGRRDSQHYVFRTGLGGLMSSNIDFLEEHNRSDEIVFPVMEILWISPETGPDIALLKVARQWQGNNLKPFVPLASREPLPDQFVATIGYPARDDRVPDQALVSQIFGDVYDKKRFAPGQLLGTSGDDIEHDCSTLGGNSGSVVFDLDTGEAVGLHYSGTFLEANYAVRASTIKDALRRLARGELNPPVSISGSGTTPSDQNQPASSTQQPATEPQSHTWIIPLEITVRVGSPTSPGISLSQNIPTTQPGTTQPNQFQSALTLAKEQMNQNKDVLEVRLGYRFRRGWITDERVIVVEVKEKFPQYRLRDLGKQSIPSSFAGVPVDVRTAPLVTQLEAQGLELRPLLERAPKMGGYLKPTNLSLNEVTSPVDAIFHVSPDSGFPNLQQFFSRTQHRITATMYEFDAEYIRDEIISAITPDDRTLKMVTDFQTPNQDDITVFIQNMKDALGDKFDQIWASVGASGKLFPSAYHIKVAVRDAEETWLSSGNWKHSGQPNIDPAGNNETAWGPLRDFNREWHAIISSPELAETFESYIKYDFSEAERVPFDEAIQPVLPDVFVPDRVFEEAPTGTPEYFDPLPVTQRRLNIQPLLTPDNYMSMVLPLLEGAQERIYFQNQSFNLLKKDEDGEDQNIPEFLELLSALKDQQGNCDVRIIIRDSAEFGPASAAGQQQLLERLKDFGFDMDKIRLQKKCHTKGIVIDSSIVVLGSHNWTNEGALFNRDASLIVKDPEVAQYYEKIFLFDWEHLAHQNADEKVGGTRIALPGEPTPLGMRRVPLAELFDD